MAGGDGQVRVVGDHPDRERIEELFAQDSWLRSRFVSLSALGSQIRAAEEGTAFAAAYGQSCEGVLEYLLKAKKFQYALVNAGVKAQATLVGANG